MTSVIDAVEPTVTKEIPPALYKVEQPVIFKAPVNNPGQYKDGDKIPGTVLSVFLNGSRWTYRIQLDLVYNEKVPGHVGQPIIVGNVTEYFMSLR